MDVMHAFALFIHVQLINCLSLGASYVVHLKMYHIIHACIMWNHHGMYMHLLWVTRKGYCE
jgi:hypothetical protein